MADSSRLSRDALNSVLLHAVPIALLMLIPADIQSHAPMHSVPPKPAESLAQPAVKKEKPLPSKETMARDSVKSQLNDLVGGELTERDEKTLLKAAEARLDTAAEQMKPSPAANLDIGEISEELKAQALADLQKQLTDLAGEAIGDEVAAQVDGVVYDQIKDKIEAEVSGKLADEIRQKTEDRLRKDREERYEKRIADLQKWKDSLAQARDQVASAADQTNHEKFTEADQKRNDAQKTLKDHETTSREALADVVRSAPQLASRAGETEKATDSQPLQKALNDTGSALAAKDKSAASGKLDEVKRGLEDQMGKINQLQDDLRQAKHSQSDPLSRELVAQSLATLKSQITDELQKQSMDGLASKITDKMTQALSSQASQFKLSPEQLRQLVEAQVKARLAANFQNRRPATDGALNALRQSQQLLSPEELARAQAASEDAAKQLQAVRDAQTALNLNDAAASAADLADSQARITEQYARAAQSLDRVQETTRAASRSNQDKAFWLGHNERKSETGSKLALLPDVVRADRRQQASTLKQEVVQNIDQRLQQLNELSQALGQEKQQLEAAQKNAPASVTIDPALLAQMQAGLNADVAAVAKQVIPGIMAGAGDIEVGGTGALDYRLGGMAGLMGKMGQISENTANGRPNSGLDAGGLGLSGLQVPGKGVLGSRFSLMNAIAMEKYGKDLRDRTNPDKFYAAVEETQKLATVAGLPQMQIVPALVVIPTSGSAVPKDKGTEAPVRKVPEPQFKTVAFAAAAMMEKPVVIDGDLSDWGELRHPIPTRFRNDGSSVSEPTQVYLRWSPEGLYLAYVTKKNGPIVASAHAGDCLELWIDGENLRRKQMSESLSAQQIFLAPFGSAGNPKATFIEVGRGVRGLDAFKSYIDDSGKLGRSAAKMTEGGYSVEAFISRRALARPNLVPGTYLAMNFSLNRGAAEQDWEQWSSPKAQMTWDKPDTWGDLLLLGSDAKASFVTAEDIAKPDESVVPGKVLTFSIADKDMDLNPQKNDRVPAVLRVKGSEQGLFVVLEETTADSGVFVGSVNTQPFAAPLREDTLNIHGGDLVELDYIDARAEFGESNRPVLGQIQIGAPVLTLSAK